MSADRCESARVSATDLKAADHAVADLDVVAAPDDAGIDRSQENDCRRNRTDARSGIRRMPTLVMNRNQRLSVASEPSSIGGVKFEV
jgi:hypothetical protein